MRLTPRQIDALRRLARGDSYRPRYHSQFCFSESEKWVKLWKSDGAIAHASTINALVRHGFYYAGAITTTGLEALKQFDPTAP